MEERNIYVVAGDTGCYSDQYGWNVRAFFDKEEAEALRERLEKWCQDRGLVGFDANNRWDGSKPPEDPDFRCDHGTRYYVFPVPLHAADVLKIKVD